MKNFLFSLAAILTFCCFNIVTAQDCVDTTISLTSETYGDGWWGATYEISDADGNVVASGPSDMGAWSSLDDTFCLLPGSYSLDVTSNGYNYDVVYGYGWSFAGESGYTSGSFGPFSIGAAPASCTDVAYTLGGGSYDSEMSFSIDGASFGAGSGTVCLADGCFDVTLTDSWGDGWNGGTLTLGSDSFGLASGASGSGIFGVNTDCNVYGCMDSFATNYSADANTDDGTCEYDCSTYAGNNADCQLYVWDYGYTVSEMIGYGYNCICVEDPVPGCMDTGACNYDAAATLDSGCDYSCLCNDTSISCDGGSWQTEVSWSISDCDGNVLVSGGAPFSDCVALPDTYVITMADSYGDGWNGNVLTIGDASYDVTTNGDGLNGSATVGACPVYGCTDSSACNFTEGADTDDGSCTYAAENFDCAGNCTATVDCNGDCAGTAVADDCGVCAGDNSSCTDDCGVVNGDNSSCAGCDGVANSGLVEDECGVCGGSGPLEGFDCAGDPLVCDGEGTNDNTTIAFGFGDFGINNCEGVINYLASSYGFSEEAACGWDGDMGMGSGPMFGGATLGDICGCSCAPVAAPTCESGQTEVVLTAMDSWGDGWNGNVANVYFDGVLFDPAGVGFTYTLASGSEEVTSFCVDNSSLATCLTMEVVCTGFNCYDGEVSWTLADALTGGAGFFLEGGAPYTYASDNCPVPGCTDESAANYNPDATEDDGSCIASCTDLAWTMGGGSYIGETSFTITDANGNEVAAAAGADGSGSVCLADGCYDVNMIDSWGDGWNGNVLTIGDSSFELVSGSAGSSPLDVNGGGCGIVNGCTDSNASNYNADANMEDGSCEYTCEYLLSYDSYANSYDNTFSNYYCDYYVSAGMYTIDEMINEFGYNCDCVTTPVPGCTDDTASNYNADATVEDGSCTYDCAEGTIEATLNMYDSWGDGWNGGSITIVVDGTTVVDAAAATGSGLSISACISEGILAGTSCVEITVVEGSYPEEMSWDITAYDGGVTLAAGDGFFGTGALGCAVDGCMDETACNYDADATTDANDSCIYPEANADCDGNFSCDGVAFTLDMYDSYGDGWNGATFSVVDYFSGEVVAGPYTNESSDMESTDACFPEDMVWGCYIISVGGGTWDEEISWHLYGFEVFGSYVVDYSAGMAIEWDGVGGDLIFGDSQNIADLENGGYIPCDDPSGFCEGAMDYPSGAGDYDIGYGCDCLDPTASNYCPECPMDESDNTDDPCVYITDVPGCTDSMAENFNPDATADDGSCEYACAGSGEDNDAFVADNLGTYGITSCNALTGYVITNYGYDLDSACAWDGTGSPFSFGGLTVADVCGCTCPDVVVEPTCTDVSITLETAFWAYEMSWDITDADGAVVASGVGVNDFDIVNSSVCLEDGCYTVNMADSYGDGWGGAVLIVDGQTFTGPAGSYPDATEGTGVFGVNADCNVYGCTDDTATNYNADANTEDGSCEYDCATWLDTTTEYTCYWWVWVDGGYTIDQMLDFGYDCTCVDTPVYGCTDETACNYDETANFNQGCDFTSCTCDGTAVTYVEGGWAYENSFSIQDCDGNVLASMADGVGYDECLDLPDNFSITMTDSFGDGWNGGVLLIGGVSYTLDAVNDDGSMSVSYVGECGVLGCMDETACNFNADATIDDGSCFFAQTALGLDCDGACLDVSATQVVLTAMDSWGDGWNGNLANVYFDGELFDPLGLGFTYTLLAEWQGGADGAMEVVPFCIDASSLASCLEITVGGGSFQSEVSWTLADAATGGLGFYLEGGAPYEFASDNCPVFGCTDDTAANYNPDATDDDGSCVASCTDVAVTVDGGSYQYEVSWTLNDLDGAEVAAGGAPFDGTLCLADDCYIINMTDSWGDGWNGNVMTINGETFTLESGASGSFGFGLIEGCDIYNVVPGCIDETACNYNPEANEDDGSCTYPAADFFDCNFNFLGCGDDQIEMLMEGYDSFGDGWNGANASIYLDGVLFDPPGFGFSYTLEWWANPDGASDYSAASFCVDASATCIEMDVTGGFYPSEITFALTNVTDGTVLFEGGAPFSGQLGCPIYGCMDETASNYNPDADTDDGSCAFDCTDTAINCDGGSWQSEVSWSITDGEGNVVVSGGAPFDGSGCFADGCYTVTVTDSYGDGWNGNVLDIGGLTFTNDNLDALYVEESQSFELCFPLDITEGCMDDTATNYNPDANSDDGSCEYDCATWLDTEALYTCYYYMWNYEFFEYTIEDLETGFGYDCTCVEDPVDGCMDETACNYDPNATLGTFATCDYVSCTCDGVAVTVDGGSFQTEVSWSIVDCDGAILAEGGAPFSECLDITLPDNYSVVMNDSWGDGWNGNVMTIGDTSFELVTGSTETVYVGSCGVLGCIDEAACNYDETATIDDGSCTYPQLGFDCDGVCDGIAVTLTAMDSWGDGWNGAVANVYFDNVLFDPLGLGFTYTMVTGSEEVTSFCVDNSALAGCLQITVGGGNYDNEISWSLVDDATGGLGFSLEGGAPYEYASDNCPVYGCMDSAAVNFDETATEDDGSCQYDCTVYSVVCDGGSWQSEVGWTIADADGNVVAEGGAPFTGDACLSDGCYTVSMTDSFGDGWNGNTLTINGESFTIESGSDGSAVFGINTEGCNVFGCTDETAENYDASANTDDGSCEYDCATWLDTDELYSCYYYMWNYEFIEYSIEELEGYGYDCTCVEDPVDGCMDETACNYNPDATLETFDPCDYVSCGCEDNVLVVGGGTYDYEITWNITDCDGTIIVEGAAPYNECVVLPADYLINMYDSFGDGWNGATMTVDGVEVANLATGAEGLAQFGACLASGCMDELASNYDSAASVDDGSCEYDCDTYPVDTADFSCYWYVNTYPDVYTVEDMIGYGYDCTCVTDPVGGCLSSLATNYNPDASYDDGSCEYDCAALGLSDATSTSGGGSWTGEVSWSLVDSDGTIMASGGAAVVATDATQNFCIDPDACYTILMEDSFGDGWNGNILTINGEEFTLDAGEAGTAPFGNCVFECNATELAVTVNNGEGTDFGYSITDADGGTVWVEDGIGCFDLDNGCYTVSLSSSSGIGDQGATLTIGDTTFGEEGFAFYSSIYEEVLGSGCPVLGCIDETACNFNADADTDDGSCYYQDDCDAEFCFTESFDDLAYASESTGFGTWSGTDADDAMVQSGAMIISSDAGVDVVTTLPTFGTGVWEASFEMTVFDGFAAYFNFGNSGDVAAWDWENQFYFNIDGSANDDFGNTWAFTPGSTMQVSTFIDLDNGDAITQIDGETVATWSWTGALGGANFFAYTDNYFAVDNFSLCVGEMPVTSVAGCTDSSACNFDSAANEDDGSCTYADSCNSCDGPIDSDGDGVADCDEVVGCQDMAACNYDPNATDAGTCEYTDGVYDCDGVTCLLDTDGDGVCDQNEVSGCTDSSASNYSDVATDDDGSCMYPVMGCTDPAAGNYDPNADTDDDSCDYGPWDVSSTDCNMTVLLPGDLDITVEGDALSGSIWIGVTDADGNVYGSTQYTSGTTTSIAVWGAEAGEDNGMEAGETLNWMVMSDGEELSANVSYDFGAGTYSCNGLAGLSGLAATSVVTQAIDLNEGWNIWSTYVAPEDTDMAGLFSGIVDDIVICKDENGAVYWPAFSLNNIGDITDAAGYQVKTGADVTLEVTGALLDPSMSFNIEEGWGIIGYVKTEASDAADMMAPVVDNLIIMKDENGSVYWPAFSLNNIGNMMAGEGYQIKMDSDAMFAYTSGSGRLGYAEPIRTVHYDAAHNTGSNMTIGLPTTAWELMPAIGDEIAAYDESGSLIGSTSFNGENIALTIWGDDLTTDAKDGLAIGERVTFKLWNSDMNTESTLVVTKWDAGSDAYTIDGISIASNIILSGDSSADTHKLYQNVPNPFNGTTTIGFYVPANENVTIAVYNMLGEYVAEIANDVFSAGKHEVVFNSDKLSQGTYFVRMTTEGFTATKNMNIIK